MFDKNPTAIAGSLRRVWRNAGAPVNGTTLAGSADKGDLLIDSTNAALYQNTNTKASPTWTQFATGSTTYGVVDDMAANGTSTANTVGTGNAARVDHVHKLGTHDHSDDTKGGATLGAVTISSITLSGDIDMSGQGTGTYDILLKDAVADALSIKRGSTDVIVFDTTTPKVTITPATTVTGTLTASTGITVSAGGINVTGDSVITGALEVTGALTIGGAWTLGATLTVDELILDTDGTAPAGTNAYVVSDNTGDLTLNALAGKEVHIAIAGTDVLDIGSGVEVISGGLTVTLGGLTVSAGGATITGATGITGNVTITGDLAISGAFSFGGALTINDTVTVDELILDTDGTAPAGTNAYLVSDNTGDVTINALTGKEVIIAINGTDEYDFGAAIADFKGNAIDNAGYLILNAASAPANTEVYLVNDNTGDLTLNAVTGKSIHFAIAGTDEFNITAAALEIASGNAIKFLGNNGIVDSNGNEVLLVEAVADATTYLNIKNANGGNVVLECQGAADLGFTITNDQDEEILILTPVASAVNEITILNAITGGQPAIRVTGEADNGLEIQNLAGEIMLETASTSAPVNWLTIYNADTGARPGIETTGEADIGLEIRNAAHEVCFATVSTNAPTVYIQASPANTGGQPILKIMGEADLGLEIQNADGEVECEFVSVATAVNWLSISNAATSNRPIILSAGEDDIGIEFHAKNGEEMLILAAVAAAVNEITITSAATGNAPAIAASGANDNIDLSLAGKGTGYVRMDSSVDMSDNTLYGSVAENGNLILSSTVHATKGFVGIASGEEGIRIGGSATRGTVGTNSLHLYVGTAPSGALNNCVSIYAEGADAASECKVMDAAGNVTVLSPHTDDGDYVIHSYSAKKDETVTIHLEKMLKAIATSNPELAKYVVVETSHIKKPKEVK